MANTINVTSDTVVKLIIRRGTNIDRQTVVLANGELGYAIDTKRVYVGDGLTLGGTLVGNKNFGIVQGIESLNGVAQAGDVVFQNITNTGALDNILYAFNNGQWQSINPVYGAPFDYSTGSLIFNSNYLSLDAINSILNVYGGITSYTLKTVTASADMITIYNDPIYGTDGVNLNALLSGAAVAELYTRNYVGNNFVPLSGQATINGTLSSTTNISVSTLPVNGNDLANKTYVDQASFNATTAAEAYTVSRFLPLSGGTLTDALTSYVNCNTPAVLIKQYGIGAALRGEDTNYYQKPFIVDNFGSVGIGVVPPAGATTQLTVNGSISASSSAIIHGSVGIGTSTPNTKLHVEGLITLGRYQGIVSKDNETDTFIAGGNNYNQGGEIYLSGPLNADGGIITFATGTSGTNGANIEAMRINKYGNIGVGTNNPTAKLHVYGGDILMQRTTNDGAVTFGAADTYIYGNTNTNYITLGTNNLERVRVDVNGKVGIGTSSPGYNLDVTGTVRATGDIYAQGDIIAFFTSDARLKNNIKPIASALDKIDNINGVEYDWNIELQSAHTGHDVGVIAQEIEQVLPEAVETRDSGYKAVNYNKVIPLLLQAIKELKAEVEALKSK